MKKHCYWLSVIVLTLVLHTVVTPLAGATADLDVKDYVSKLLSWEYDKAVVEAAQLRILTDDSVRLTTDQAIEIIKYLLQEGAKLPEPDRWGNDAFTDAAGRHDIKLMEALIGFGYKITSEATKNVVNLFLITKDYNLLDKFLVLKNGKSKLLKDPELELLLDRFGYAIREDFQFSGYLLFDKPDTATREDKIRLIEYLATFKQLIVGKDSFRPIATAFKSKKLRAVKVIIDSCVSNNLKLRDLCPEPSKKSVFDKYLPLLSMAAISLVDSYNYESDDTSVNIKDIIELMLSNEENINQTLQDVFFSVWPRFYSGEETDDKRLLRDLSEREEHFYYLVEIPIFFKDIEFTKRIISRGANIRLVQPHILLASRKAEFVRELQNLGANTNGVDMGSVKNALFLSINERNDPFTAFLFQNYSLKANIGDIESVTDRRVSNEEVVSDKALAAAPASSASVSNEEVVSDKALVKRTIESGDCVSLYRLIKLGFVCPADQMFSWSVHPYVISIVNNSLSDLKIVSDREKQAKTAKNDDSEEYYEFYVEDRDHAMPNKTTPLMWAAAFGREEMVSYLLSQGHDPNIRYCPNKAFDNVPKSALDLATELGHTACVQALMAVTKMEHDFRDEYIEKTDIKKHENDLTANGSVNSDADINDDIYHIVRAGESAFRISQNYGISTQDFFKWNNKKSWDEFDIHPGDRVIVKDPQLKNSNPDAITTTRDFVAASRDGGGGGTGPGDGTGGPGGGGSGGTSGGMRSTFDPNAIAGYQQSEFSSASTTGGIIGSSERPTGTVVVRGNLNQAQIAALGIPVALTSTDKAVISSISKEAPRVTENTIAQAPEGQQTDLQALRAVVNSRKGQLTSLYRKTAAIENSGGAVTIRIFGRGSNIETAQVTPTAGNLPRSFLSDVKKAVESWSVSGVSGPFDYEFTMRFYN